MTGIIVGYLFVFFARITDMSLDTLRVIFIVKGRRFIGSLLGFIEVLIWICVIRIIFSELDNIGNMIAYAAGFATGNYLGAFIEEKIALGSLSVQVILSKCDGSAAEVIRESGYGVSELECKGKDGQKTLLIINIQRKQFSHLENIIAGIDPDAFISVMDTRKILNGYFNNSVISSQNEFI